MADAAMHSAETIPEISHNLLPPKVKGPTPNAPEAFLNLDPEFARARKPIPADDRTGVVDIIMLPPGVLLDGEPELKDMLPMAAEAILAEPLGGVEGCLPKPTLGVAQSVVNPVCTAAPVNPRSFRFTSPSSPPRPVSLVPGYWSDEARRNARGILGPTSKPVADAGTDESAGRLPKDGIACIEMLLVGPVISALTLPVPNEGPSADTARLSTPSTVTDGVKPNPVPRPCPSSQLPPSAILALPSTAPAPAPAPE